MDKNKIKNTHNLKWWEVDRFGWPIEISKGRYFKNMIRFICQNFRKLNTHLNTW